MDNDANLLDDEFEDAEYILPIYIPLHCNYELKKFIFQFNKDFVEYSLQLNIYFKNVDKTSHSYWKTYFKKINTLWRKDFSNIVKNKLKNKDLIILHFN